MEPRENQDEAPGTTVQVTGDKPQVIGTKIEKLVINRSKRPQLQCDTCKSMVAFGTEECPTCEEPIKTNPVVLRRRRTARDMALYGVLSWTAVAFALIMSMGMRAESFAFASAWWGVAELFMIPSLGFSFATWYFRRDLE